MLMSCLIAFVSSMVVDLVVTKWVQAVAANRAFKAGLFSMVSATFLLIGINQIIQDKLVVDAFWVLGYGAGSYLAVKFKSKSNE